MSCYPDDGESNMYLPTINLVIRVLSMARIIVVMPISCVSTMELFASQHASLLLA
jgi:hypothetical protein